MSEVPRRFRVERDISDWLTIYETSSGLNLLVVEWKDGSDDEIAYQPEALVKEAKEWFASLVAA